MHNHGDNSGTEGHNSKMMWFMMLGCLLPVLLIGFAGRWTGRSSLWVLLLVGGMLVLHWLARRGHGNEVRARAVGDQPVVTASVTQADAIVPPSTADLSVVGDEHKHDCCR